MNGFNRVIYIIVLFIVGFVWFNIVSLLRFPHLRVFVYALEPKGLILRLWSYVRAGLTFVFGIVMMFLIMMYFIWLLIKKFVPNFPIPFKKILLKIPPFPQLERAGIFAFIGNLFKAIFSRSKLPKRLKLVGKTFADFIRQNTGMILAALGIKSDFIMDQLPPQRKIREPREKKKKKKYDDSAERKIDDEYQQCLEENTVPITEEMSKTEKETAGFKNTISRTVCQTKKVQSYSRTLSGIM